MIEDIKTRINELINSIDDENLLQIVQEDIAYYTNNKDIFEELDEQQLKELDNAITEVDNNDTIDWNDLKKEMDEWKKGNSIKAFSKECVKNIRLFTPGIFCKNSV